MITYPAPEAYNTPALKKKVVSTSKYYDEAGRLTSEDVTEEYEYFEPKQTQTLRQPYITNGINAVPVGTRTFATGGLVNDPDGGIE